jgi:hypothetical protein
MTEFLKVMNLRRLAYKKAKLYEDLANYMIQEVNEDVIELKYRIINSTKDTIKQIEQEEKRYQEMKIE